MPGNWRRKPGSQLRPRAGTVSLLLPADTAWTEGGKPGKTRAKPSLRKPDAARIEDAARKLKDAKKPVILINGSALTKEGLAQGARLKAAGLRVITDTFFPRQTRGAGTFIPDRMQYFAEGAMADLEGADLMLVAGTQVPVAFFSYPGKPSVLVPEGCTPYIIGGPESDSAAILEALADAIGAKESAVFAELDIPGQPTGDLNAMTVGMALARQMPEGTFVSDDGVSNGLPCFLMTQRAQPHDWMMLTGGAIGRACRSPLAQPSLRRTARCCVSQATERACIRTRPCGAWHGKRRTWSTSFSSTTPTVS